MVVLLDMSKALDSVRHDLMLSKLQSIGVSSATCDWFGSYLSQQSQVVNVDWGFRQVARDYPKSFLEFLKKLLKRSSKNNQKVLFVTKVAQKLLENIKPFLLPC